MITRKHYIAVAKVIHATIQDHPDAVLPLSVAAARLALIFEDDNPRFDTGKFMDAAVGGGSR